MAARVNNLFEMMVIISLHEQLFLECDYLDKMKILHDMGFLLSFLHVVGGLMQIGLAP